MGIATSRVYSQVEMDAVNLGELRYDFWLTTDGVRSRGIASSLTTMLFRRQSIWAIALTRVSTTEPAGGTKYPANEPPGFLP